MAGLLAGVLLMFAAGATVSSVLALQARASERVEMSRRWLEVWLWS